MSVAFADAAPAAVTETNTTPYITWFGLGFDRFVRRRVVNWRPEPAAAGGKGVVGRREIYQTDNDYYSDKRANNVAKTGGSILNIVVIVYC